MAGIEIQPNTAFTHPAWAKDYLGREHVFPGGARVDGSQFARSNAVDVSVNGVTANEVQHVDLTNTPTGGDFTLAFGGQQTTALVYNATTAAVQAALRLLSTINGANVTVTGAAGAYIVTFMGALAGTDVGPITGNGAGLTGAGAQPAVVVTQVTTGSTTAIAAGATALPVDALSGPIPAGTTLRFGGGQLAYLSAAAASGATSLTVEPLGFAVPDGAAAQYRGTGKVYIRSGTLLGRTTAERDADTPYGVAADADDEVFLLVYDVDDALRNPDCELYRPGGLVDIVHLWSYAAASSTLKTKLASVYQLMRGAD
jgi:hypothetical protein